MPTSPVVKYMRRGRRIVPVDAYSAMPLPAKREYQMRRAGVRAEVLYECRICRVKVVGRDRDGHLRRNHSAAADVLVCFRVVKNG